MYIQNFGSPDGAGCRIKGWQVGAFWISKLSECTSRISISRRTNQEKRKIFKTQRLIVNADASV